MHAGMSLSQSGGPLVGQSVGNAFTFQPFLRSLKSQANCKRIVQEIPKENHNISSRCHVGSYSRSLPQGNWGKERVVIIEIVYTDIKLVYDERFSLGVRLRFGLGVMLGFGLGVRLGLGLGVRLGLD